jgi:hypothetical protein
VECPNRSKRRAPPIPRPYQLCTLRHCDGAQLRAVGSSHPSLNPLSTSARCPQAERVQVDRNASVRNEPRSAGLSPRRRWRACAQTAVRFTSGKSDATCYTRGRTSREAMAIGRHGTSPLCPPHRHGALTGSPSELRAATLDGSSYHRATRLRRVGGCAGTASGAAHDGPSCSRADAHLQRPKLQAGTPLAAFRSASPPRLL